MAIAAQRATLDSIFMQVNDLIDHAGNISADTERLADELAGGAGVDNAAEASPPVNGKIDALASLLRLLRDQQYRTQSALRRIRNVVNEPNEVATTSLAGSLGQKVAL